MARIIPWKLPDVAGGSEGGYTPAPTPDTPEEQEYYDFTDVVITRTPAHGTKANSLYIRLSGVVVDDLTGVSSASIYAKVGYSNVSQAAADSATKDLMTKAFTASQILEPNANYLVLSLSNQWFTVGEVGVIVYNGNGEILKQYVLTEDLDGE